MLCIDEYIITTKQFESAIKNALSSRQIEVLQILYSFPNAAATAQQLADVLNPFSPSTIVANGWIGRIGRAISEHTGVTPPSYFNGKKDSPAYFLIIGGYFKDSGWNMRDELQEALENLNLVNSVDEDNVIERLPTETFLFDERELFKEGKVSQVFVNRFERNQEARLQCIKHHGDSCHCCGFNFGKVYGSQAEGFIHVHHKKHLAEIGEEYEVDPITDLVPLCPNCHSVIHLAKPTLTIEELKRLMKKASKH